MSELHSFISAVTFLLNELTVSEYWKNDSLIFLCYLWCNDSDMHTFKSDSLINTISVERLSKLAHFFCEGQESNMFSFMGLI